MLLESQLMGSLVRRSLVTVEAVDTNFDTALDEGSRQEETVLYQSGGEARVVLVHA